MTMDDIYGIKDWAGGLFCVLDNGHIGLCNPDNTKAQPTDLLNLVQNLKQRGIETPVLLRVTDFLKSKIDEINKNFEQAITESEYKGHYQGVFPIKVNQQAEVVARIAEYGAKYDFGFEVGFKSRITHRPLTQPLTNSRHYLQRHER